MSNQKKNRQTITDSLPALRIGSRVRCTGDGVEGRITWANGVAVKIRWDDGEQVTWRRDSLAGRPIDILGQAGAEGQSSTTATTTEDEQTIPDEEPPTQPATTSSASEVVPTEATPSETETAPAAQTLPITELVPEQAALPLADEAAEVSAQTKRQRKQPATSKAKKLSALDAAARVLAEEGKPMSCLELIAMMTAKGYWASPNGRTPASTLYSAILRETTTKGSNCRFVKAERGKFILSGVV